MARTTSVFVVASIMTLLILGGGTISKAQELLHGVPDFDSGWVDFPPGEETIVVHGVGGDIDDYVVDLQVRDLVDGHGGGYRVHQTGFGGDDMGGFWWEKLTDNQMVIRSGDAAGRLDQFRVRIWLVPFADYDSGWVWWEEDQYLKLLTHALQGAVADYVVDLQFIDFEGKGIHTFGYGRDRFWAGALGAAWLRLDSYQVMVARGANDSYVDDFRLRIFRRPHPAYDSGWRSTPIADLPHDLGGPWNDFVVDVQLRDSNDNLGLNQVGYGGDDWYDAFGTLVEQGGSYWSHLSGRSMRFKRNPDDEAADEVRIRIWESRRPKWDSGWLAISKGETLQPSHDLGGDPQTYVVDLQFKDTDDAVTLGTNQIGYGGTTTYDSDYNVIMMFGATWHSLWEDTISIYRTLDDSRADQVRVRIWIAPEPELDLGWYDPAGQVGAFEFDIAAVPGYPNEWVLDLQKAYFGSAIWGMNQGGYGTEHYTGDGITYRRDGIAWTRLESTSVTVERGFVNAANNRFRLRIWHNMAFDWVSPWEAISALHTFSHGLGANPESLVLDLHFKDLDSEGTHNLYYGGAQSDTGPGDRQGASWFGLGSNAVSIFREAEDTVVDSARMRVWRTEGYTPWIFLDGFESGDQSAWD